MGRDSVELGRPKVNLGLRTVNMSSSLLVRISTIYSAALNVMILCTYVCENHYSQLIMSSYSIMIYGRC